MPAATLPIVINILVAGMFVASFLTIAHLNPEFPRIRWFALSYAAGMLTPVAEFLLPLMPVQAPFLVMSYAGLFIGIVLMSPALSMLYERQPAWRVVGAIIVAGIAVRIAIWNGPRGVFWYEMAYQIPFAVASFLCVVTFVKHGRNTGFDRAAKMLFFIIGLHFLLKPYFAVTMGPGMTAADYIRTHYALISQATSGILLIAAGLLVLMNALHVVVLRDRQRATTDPLTGLANRRALHAAFERLMRKDGGANLYVALFDIDRFKAINDSWGHDEGDKVICGFADCLRQTAPANGLVARIGGEEFVLLMTAPDVETAQALCEAARMSVSRISFGLAGTVTASAGFTGALAGEDLGAALARADLALYRAKENGRNRGLYEPAITRGARPGMTRLR
ncbi:GGDEF domain-containing protein [Rhizobium sp. SG2393]|uniref:GGDEF domain-containing protein n=1 Tax=Rhizobium sp. SG2393 TaxID=3276279 RepID=UPI0036734F47